MTAAICIKCGAYKNGAWTECDKCGTLPSTDEEMIESLARSDHYYSKASLDLMHVYASGGDMIGVDPNILEMVKATFNDPISRKYADLNRNSPNS